MIPESQIDGFLGMTLIVVGFGLVCWFVTGLINLKGAKE